MLRFAIAMALFASTCCAAQVSEGKLAPTLDAAQLCGGKPFTGWIASDSSAWLEWTAAGTTLSLSCSSIGSNGTDAGEFASSTAITAYVACRSAADHVYVLDKQLPTVFQGTRYYTCPVAGHFYVVFRTTFPVLTGVELGASGSIDNGAEVLATPRYRLK